MERAAQVLCGGCGVRARLFGVAAAPLGAGGSAAGVPSAARVSSAFPPRGCRGGCAGRKGCAALPDRWAAAQCPPPADIAACSPVCEAEEAACGWGEAPGAESVPGPSSFEPGAQKTPEDVLVEALELSTPAELTEFFGDPLFCLDEPPVHPCCAPRPFLLAGPTACTICTAPAPWAFKPCRGQCGALGRRLLLAAHQGRLREVWALLLRGADVNSCAAGRWTPLHRAAAKGHAPVLWLLLHKGALVDAPTAYGETALHAAAGGDRSARCVAMLLAAGAYVDSRDRLGRTPLHAASLHGNCAAARTLLGAGACADALTHDGRTPARLARTGRLRKMLCAC